MPVTIAPERLVNTATEGAQRAADVAVPANIATAWIDEPTDAAKLRMFGVRSHKYSSAVFSIS